MQLFSHWRCIVEKKGAIKKTSNIESNEIDFADAFLVLYDDKYFVHP